MKLSLVLALAVLAAPAWSQVVEPTPCSNAENTIQLNKCFAAEVTSIDKQIDLEVERVERVLNERDEKDPMFQLAGPFKIAQQKWSVFRASECAFRMLTFTYGTGAPAEEMWCKVEHGRVRLEYLKRLMVSK
ncbi:hypothetical protein DBR42_06060 [Pelomonas sp. HMWF004]|nr:hypothetical protein DBR42_06060 [Pelomonas sp. HMWF004]